ncbi:diacylglycerol/lipid kinase family protein [Tepidiforma sp.]|uniref:diacylglycerol/lipid kinase family protein n=1 Tax=Tepidiforma sp. TaxID=2682230 RepID=UPI002ADDD8AC|nr:YegS/Rv2252/BmrU family lipid kinase [Tepidiforma sp.]
MSEPAPATPRSAALVVNPAARGVRRFDPARAARYLERRGLTVHLSVPETPEAATAAARASAERGDALCLVVGGDGSLRAAAGGLAGSYTALAAVPAGTVNIWAREAGIPRGIRAAFECHLAGQTAAIDLGLADGHPFLLMAGIGWDAEIAARVNPRLKRVAGDLAYILEGLLHLPALRVKPAAWSTPAGRRAGPFAWMVLGNSRLYGGRIQLTPGAVIDDGLLDLIAFCPSGLLPAAALAARVAAGARQGSSIVSERTPELVFETPGFPVQLDGDPIGVTPMTFRVAHRALRVSLPAGPLPGVVGGGRWEVGG